MMKWRSNRRIVSIIVIAVIFLICVIFTLPLYTMSYDTIETYYDTEMKQESYIATEPYVSTELCEKEEILFDDTPYSVPAGIRVPFVVVEPNTKIIGSFELPAPGGFYIYASAGQMVYEQLGERGNIETSLPVGAYGALLRERVSWEDKVYLKLIMQWSELTEVTRYKEVTKYREVPVAVEKQRTATKHKKASLWQVIFGH